MKRDIALAALTAVNLALLVAIGWTQVRPAGATDTTDGILRGSGLEIVDKEGRLRASLNIQPGGNGATETVLLRLIHPNGQPSVKIAASLTGSGLSFVGGDDASYAILEAEGARPQLKLVQPSKGETIVAP